MRAEVTLLSVIIITLIRCMWKSEQVWCPFGKRARLEQRGGDRNSGRTHFGKISICFNNDLSLYFCTDVNRACLYGCFNGNPLCRKEKDIYRTMAKFWGHLFLINFAVGVVTGILQEFQFGMNWSEYSRFVGDVFGAPLAVAPPLSLWNRRLSVCGSSAGTAFRRRFICCPFGLFRLARSCRRFGF